MSDARLSTENASALLIDDDIDLLDTWTRLAKAKGFTVATASTWDQGLALFHVLSPDLVIADYNLPGSAHGLKLLAEIRTLRPSVRLVLISGAVEPSELKKVEQLGIVHRVLSKGDSATATFAVLDEIERTASQAQLPTDWRAFAAAYLSAARSNSDDLKKVDEVLRSAMGTRQQ